ncbi:MAG: protein kinase domain-containing protein, partial [Nannocystaceae bacterium]
MTETFPPVDRTLEVTGAAAPSPGPVAPACVPVVVEKPIGLDVPTSKKFVSEKLASLAAHSLAPNAAGISLTTTAPLMDVKAVSGVGDSAIPVSLATTAPSLVAKASLPSSQSSKGISLAATLAATRPADSSSPTHPDTNLSANLARGTVVSRYIVLSTLGAGGMGVVFAAHDPELDRKVALKLLHPQHREGAYPSSTSEARIRLLREAQALAKLNHPHIVVVHDAGEHEGSVWLAMEYVEGATLGAWLASRRRTWREVLTMVTPAIHG